MNTRTAPDPAMALLALIAWAEDMGAWEAPCRKAARKTLADALGTETSQRQQAPKENQACVPPNEGSP